LIFLLGKRLLHGLFVDVEFALECVSKFWKILVASDPVHSLLRLQQAKSEPSCSLLAVVPALDVADVVFNQAVQILDRIGRLEAPSYLLEDAKPMERQRPRQWSGQCSWRPSWRDRAADRLIP